VKIIFRGVFLTNHLAITDNLTRTTKRQNTYKCKLTSNDIQKVALINSRKTSKNYAKTVAFNDIQPGNGAGLFFQPSSPHGAIAWISSFITWLWLEAMDMNWTELNVYWHACSKNSWIYNNKKSMIKTDTINRYNQVQTTKLYTVRVQFELKLWDKRAGKYIQR